MPSLLRTPLTLTSSALAMCILVSRPLEAQSSSQTSVAITVRVQPTLAIHGVVATRARVESNGRLAATSVVNVESNLPYRVAVRLAPMAAGAARVFVRSATGAFESLAPGVSITAVESRTPGRRAHEVLCQVETPASELSDATGCALLYELSAEHHDSLLRTTALPTAHPPRAGALAVADAATGR